MFERERLFQLLAKKEWNEIAKILHKNPGIIHTDVIIQQAIKLFENEFFADIQPLNAKEKFSRFEFIGLVVDAKQSSFSKSFVDRFIDEKLMILNELQSADLIGFASHHQHRPLAKKILSEIYSKSPEIIADARHQNVTIKTTKTTNSHSKTIKLFKSQQEENFFEAIRKAFPTYHPYPNVSLSCVINFDEIIQDLTQKQRDYFFKAIIDCVVFDASKGYQPMYFFELDSHFHDDERVKANDNMKDSIFAAANVKLIRIRVHKASEATVSKFQELVLDVMRF